MTESSTVFQALTKVINLVLDQQLIYEHGEKEGLVYEKSAKDGYSRKKKGAWIVPSNLKSLLTIL